MKNTSSLRDIIFLLILNLAVYGMVEWLDLIKLLHQWHQSTVSGMLFGDRLLLGSAAVGVSWAIFAWRRWGDFNRETDWREKAQADLLENEARFRQMMEHLKDIVYLTDINGPTMYINSAYEKLTGRSVESLYEQPLSWMDWIHPDDYPWVRETVANFDTNFDAEYRVIRPDGTIGWMHDRTFVIRDKAGQIYRRCGTIRDVTARKQMEETLREREQFIQRILDATPNLIFVYNLADQRLIFSNHQLTDVLGDGGVKGQSLDTLVLSDYVHADDLEHYQAHLDDLHLGQPGEILTLEYRLQQKDGEWRWFQSRETVFKRDQTGQTLEVLGIANDITTLKSIMSVLQQERAYLRQVIDAVPGLICVKNMAGRFLLANQALATAYKTTVNNLVGKTDADFNPKQEEVDFYLANNQEALANGQMRFIPEEPITYADGQTRWHSTYQVPLFDRHGQASQVLVIATDITERKQMEADLRTSQAQYQSVVDHIREVIFQLDLSGRWTFLNPAWTDITGFTLAETLGQDRLDFIYPADRQHSLELFQTLMEGKQPYCRHRMRFLIKPETTPHQPASDFCWMEVHARLTFDTDGIITGASGTLRDISEIKQAEESIQRLNAELEERVQQRTAELSQANQQLAQEIIERQLAQESLQQRADMENLIAMISTHFIDMPPDQLDQNFNWALQIVGEFIGVDRSYIIQLSEDRQEVNNTHEWCAAGIDPQITRLQGIPCQAMLWSLNKLTQAETIQISRVANLPDEASSEKALLQAQQIQSVVVVPLISSGVLIGFLGFDSVLSEKMWHDADVTLLRMVGEIMVNALHRQQADVEIQRRNRELMMLNRITDASMLASDPEGMLTMVCQELVNIFNLVQAQAVLFNETKTEASVVAEVGSTNLSRLKQTLQVNDVPLLQQVLIQKSPLTPQSSGFTWGQFQPGDLLDTTQVVSAIILPLGMNDDIVGILSLGADRPRAFSTQDFGLLWNVADQISIALTRIHLAQNQKRMAAVIDQISDAVIITDPADQIVYVNPAFEQMTGYSPGEVLGQNPRLLKSHKNDPSVYTDLWSTIAKGHTWRGRSINKKKDSSFYTCDMTISPVFDEFGEIMSFVAIERDISQSLQLEEQYRQAQKMESVGRLASGVAHDFNNILTAILGYTGLSIQSLPEDSPIRVNLQGIETSAVRGANLTRQLLAFARKQVIETRPVNLNELLSGVSKILRRLVSENIELVILPAADLGLVKADPGQLEQVLLNLVVNAHDAMPEGGKVIMETANVILTQTEVQGYIGVAAGNYVMLSVTDTGIGMSDEVKAHIFEPFYTTKAPGKGTGLGLATCFGIVKQNEGHILVESEPGKGTTFKVFLPRLAEATGATPVHNGTTALPGGKETILLVEDEPLARNIAARNLRQLGYTVFEAENGEEALREIDRLGSEKLQLLMTDIVMPQLGGKALVEVLRPIYPDLKILLMSGYTEEVITQPYLAEVGAIFLQKPFSPAAMAYKVRALLDQGNS